MKNVMFGVISGLLMVCTVHAQEPVDRRADELKVYLDLESKDTNVKLDQILHQLDEVNQKVVTLSFIQRYGDEITTLAGDFMVDDLGGPYHLILMSNIVHGLGPDEMDTLLPRIRQALIPGGVLAIKDMFLDHTMARPEPAALFGLTMLMYTSDGRSHTQGEMQRALERADFCDFDVVDLRDQRFTVLLAR